MFQTLVSDNVPQFKSQEFKDFLDRLGLLHKPTPPYHPSLNGMAERFVQTVKQSLKAMASEGESLQVRLDKFLLAYRNAPHAITVHFMGRRLCTRLLSSPVNSTTMPLTELPLTATDQDYLMSSKPSPNQTIDEIIYDTSQQQTVQERTRTALVPPTLVEHDLLPRRSTRVRTAQTRSVV